MPSIRRSLIVYFLILLTLALGGIAFLADGVTGNALDQKEKASVDLIHLGALDKERAARDKFDRELLTQARDTARTATGDYAVLVDQTNRRLSVSFALALLGTPTSPTPGGWLSPVVTQTMQPAYQGRNGRWFSGQLWGPLFQAYGQANAVELRYTDFLSAHLDEDDTSAPLVQINNPRQLVWKSARLPADGLPFDHDQWEREKTQKFGDDWRYDTLYEGTVRRVMYKPNTGGFRWGGGRDTRPPPAREPGPSFSNIYHVARPTTELESEVAAIHHDAERQQAEVRGSTASTRSTVRLVLTLGSGFAFFALLVGGWVLVSVGLRPLRKLTDAVAGVNEKDLHLPVRAGELSHELVPIHDRLVQTLGMLREAFDREKQAVADISHELRTPVASLLATIDITLRKPRTAEQYKQALEDCRLLTKQLGGLVERVMTLAYLDAGQTTVTAAPTDAAELASGCAAVIRPLAESHGLTLTTDLRPTPPVDTDADKLREVMINLLHNAVEYNRPGGRITLAVRREVNGAANGGALVVEVSDTGIGMPQDVRGRIFERFYRADASRTATGVHAGLGLAIVKEYVTRLGGTISVESEVDRGSTFRVTLPA
jgi:signal transduction histidine kinase